MLKYRYLLICIYIAHTHICKQLYIYIHIRTLYSVYIYILYIQYKDSLPEWCFSETPGMNAVLFLNEAVAFARAPGPGHGEAWQLGATKQRHSVSWPVGEPLRTGSQQEAGKSRKTQEIPWNIALHFINFRSFQDVPSKLELDSAGCSMPQGMCTPQNMCVIFIRVSGMGLFVWTIGSPWIYWLLITYNHYSASLLPFPGYHRWLSQSERQAPSKQHTCVSQSGGPPQLSGVSAPRTKSGNSKELAFLSLSNDLLQSYSFEFRSGPTQTPIIHTKLQLNAWSRCVFRF